MMLNRKKWLVSGVAAVLAVATIWGILAVARRGGGDPVYVYDFSIIGMTEFWGDSKESYGPVTTDRIQTVMLTETQTVTEILVAQGDTVKKGDLLMTYDTTLDSLGVERKRLAMEKLKLELEDEENDLANIKQLKPMEDTGGWSWNPFLPSTGDSLSGCEIYPLKPGLPTSNNDGSKEELPLICWITKDTKIDQNLLFTICKRAQELQAAQPIVKPSPAPSPTFDPEPTPTPTPEEMQPGETPEKSPEETPEEKPEQPVIPSPEETPTPIPSPEPTPTATPTPTPEVLPEEPPEELPEGGLDGQMLSAGGKSFRIFFLSNVEEEQEKTEEPEEPKTIKGVYAVIKQTEGDKTGGFLTVWQGILIDTKDLSFKLYDAFAVEDYTDQQQEIEIPEMPEMNTGSGYTAEQIADMWKAKEKSIKELQYKLKMAEADYKIAQAEVNDGNVYAQLDGVVVSVLSEEQAKADLSPVIKVSDGGGFYVEGSISELEREQLKIGQEVSVSDYRTGTVCMGTVKWVGDYPTNNDGYNGMGNPNCSYYPFRVFVDGTEDLVEGYYVSIQYSLDGGGNGIYLQNPYIRTENGTSYVYAMGSNGRLEKRQVVTGKYLWGSYTEICSGLTPEDKIAFPYGKNVKPGAATKHGDYSTMYG